jgi:SAM-dependent methyltransferase
MLTVRDYESRENAAVSELPNRVVEMVSPVTFASEGYPTRVRSESELWKYLDVMHETRFERDFVSLFQGGLTEREFALLRRAAQLAHDFSQEFFGRNLTARGSLLRALNIYRHIADIFGGTPARVFEIGPGSGYLGCLFILNGWSYAATDITQAFYLLQNHLWNRASDGRLKDLVADTDWDGKRLPGQPVHFPWWEFFRLPDKEIPAVDVVTCNHALAEMHPNSMAFALRIAREMLRGGGVKAFVLEGWGYEKFVPRSAITREFYRSGFGLVYNDGRIAVFVPQDADFASAATRLPRCAWLFGAGSSDVTAAADRANRRQPLLTALADLKETMGSLFFLSGLKQLALTFRFWPPRVASRSNEISRRFFEGREQRGTERLVGIGQVNEFYAALLKTNDLLTADERFLAFIGKTV